MVQPLPWRPEMDQPIDPKKPSKAQQVEKLLKRSRGATMAELMTRDQLAGAQRPRLPDRPAQEGAQHRQGGAQARCRRIPHRCAGS